MKDGSEVIAKEVARIEALEKQQAANACIGGFERPTNMCASSPIDLSVVLSDGTIGMAADFACECGARPLRLYRSPDESGEGPLQCLDCIIKAGQGKVGTVLSMEEPVILSRAELVDIDGLTEKETLVKDVQDARTSLLECERRLHRRNRFASFLGNALAVFLVLLFAVTLAALWYRWVWLGLVAR